MRHLCVRDRAMADRVRRSSHPNDALDTASIAAERLTRKRRTSSSACTARVEPTRIASRDPREAMARPRRRGTARFPAGLATTSRGRLDRLACPGDLRTRRSRSPGRPIARCDQRAQLRVASVYMADFEDANTPTWRNMIEGQRNLMDGDRPHHRVPQSDGRVTSQREDGGRSWSVAAAPCLRSTSSSRAADRGRALRFRPLLLPQREAATPGERHRFPSFYLPKLESHREARLWNEIFKCRRTTAHSARLIRRPSWSRSHARVRNGRSAYELREPPAVSTAGRWDYMFASSRSSLAAAGSCCPTRAGVHDRSFHARLYGAAGEDLPSTRRLRAGRDGGVHPEPSGRRRHRGRAREGHR